MTRHAEPQSKLDTEGGGISQGTGQKVGGLVANYGDGLATDPAVLTSFPIPLSDPNPFFQGLMKRPYLNQVSLIGGR